MRDESTGTGIQRHLAQHPVRAAAQPAAPRVPAHAARNPAFQPHARRAAARQRRRDLTLGDYLEPRIAIRALLRRATTSCPWARRSGPRARRACCGFPARFFAVLRTTTALLTVNDRPVWRVIRGGSREYVEATRGPVARANPSQHPGGADPAAAATACCAHAHGQRRTLRPRVHRLPQRPGAGSCWRTPARRSARYWAHCPTSATKRCCTPTTALLPRAIRAPGRPGTITADPATVRACRGHLQHEHAAGAATRRAFLRDTQQQRRDRSGQDTAAPRTTTIPVFTPRRRWRRSSATARSAASTRALLLRRVLALRFSRGRRGQRLKRRCGAFQSRSLLMHSALYHGWVRASAHRAGPHALPLPAVHAVPGPGRTCRACSRPLALVGAARRAGMVRRARPSRRPRPCRWRRRARLVEQRTGRAPPGPMRLLTHLRYFGYGFNPVSFYYCFDAAGERGRDHRRRSQQHALGRASLLRAADRQRNAQRTRALALRVRQAFHVSPFMPMDMHYGGVSRARRASVRAHAKPPAIAASRVRCHPVI